MNCEHFQSLLDDYEEGTLSFQEKRRLEKHVSTCATCQKHWNELRIFLDNARALSGSAHPDEDLWPQIQAQLPERQPSAHHPSKSRKWRAPALLAAVGSMAALLVLFVLSRSQPPGSEWRVRPVSGAPLVDAAILDDVAPIAREQWLTTDARSSAKLDVGAIGELHIEPNSRLHILETKTTEHRVELTEGTLHALIWAPPRLFFVETPSATAIDLGCAYTLSVDEEGASILEVTAGYVEMNLGNRIAVIPAGYRNKSLPGVGPGTPYSTDASAAFQKALDIIDFQQPTHAEITTLLKESQAHDALTLWLLLFKFRDFDKEEVCDRLAELVPFPEHVTRDGVLKGDRDMMRRWGERFGGEVMQFQRL